MIKKAALSVILALGALAAAAPPAFAQAGPRAARQASWKSLEETRDLIKALRSMEGHTAGGMNYREFGRELGDLIIAVRALDEVLEQRKDADMRRLLAHTLAPYKDAQHIWDWCVKTEQCSYGFYRIEEDGVGKVTRDLLKDYPSLNAQEKNGGIFSDHPQSAPGTVFRSTIISALWQIGSERSRALRGLLQR